LRRLRELVPKRRGYLDTGRLVGCCPGAWQDGRRALRNRGLGGRDRIAAVRQDPAGLEGSEHQHTCDDAFQKATTRFVDGRLGCLTEARTGDGEAAKAGRHKKGDTHRGLQRFGE
jgi:hypothetical protein